MVVIILVIHGIGSAYFCAWLADEKGRNFFAWGLLGLIFGLLALIAIAAMDRVQDEVALSSLEPSVGLEEATVRPMHRDPRPWIKD